MRVTNSMISNSSQIHIANAKTSLMTAENQYTTHKKIQRPSDDPTVAVRALQLRTAYAKIEQYKDTNVGEAMNWMDTTEGALTAIDSVLTDMLGVLNQGANDDLDIKQRNSILSVLRQYANAIFEDSANKDYSGRYMFTGYRTDTSLLFMEHTDNLQYDIVQHLDGSNINAIRVVSGGPEYAAGKTVSDYAKEVPVENTAYCMQLSYDKCRGPEKDPSGTVTDNKVTITMESTVESTKIDNTQTPPTSVTIPKGTQTTLNVISMSSEEANAYNIDKLNNPAPPATAPTTPYDAIFVYDTGEIVFTESAYSDIQAQKAEITVNYGKDEFDEGDIRPEMYFECESYNTQSRRTIKYADPSGQSIKYEVNFSQTATVNTQAKDAITTDIYRVVDYIERMVTESNRVDEQLNEVEKLIANTPETDKVALANYNKLKEMLETEQRLRKGVLTEAFGKGITMVNNAQDDINVALADLGTRYNRLELTYDRLTDDKVDTKEKMSANEDVDIADAYIYMTQAYDLYQASLSATAKILGNSLLNYI